MEFNQYQALAKTTAIYPDAVRGLYPLLGLVGETGEVVEKILASIEVTMDAADFDVESDTKTARIMELLKTVKEAGKELEVLKKDIRKNGLPGVVVTIKTDFEKKDGIIKELGDQMWYQAATCSDFGLNMDAVAQANYDKLKSRQERNVLDGSGDNR